MDLAIMTGTTAPVAVPVTTPKNIIFTGVAGTGKTYRLQQLAKEYTELLSPIDIQSMLTTLVTGLNWWEVICLIFLEQRNQQTELLKVSDIVQHNFFQAKARLNNINKKHYNQTAWGNLQRFSSPHSVTVKQANRASHSYFDKDETSNWYLLEDALPLLNDLQAKLNDFLATQDKLKTQNSTVHAQGNSPINTPTAVNTPKKERFSLVSFHQSYGYDEFVEGIRPIIDEQSGQMKYGIQLGAFLKLCEAARKDPSHRYAMLIDEINRANVVQVFGELMSLIEPSKRAGQSNAMSVRLAYSGRSFSVPSNIDIFATMNTQDHSLVNLDSAFRRRFEFVEMLPDSSILSQVADAHGEVIDLGKLLKGLNHRICQHLGEQYQLGQAYFYDVSNIYDLLKVMARQILPQLLTHTTHNRQALIEIMQLEKTDWLLTSKAINSQYNSSPTDYIQVSYGGQPNMTIHPELQKLLTNSYLTNSQSIDLSNSSFLSNISLAKASAFTSLYE